MEAKTYRECKSSSLIRNLLPPTFFSPSGKKLVRPRQILAFFGYLSEADTYFVCQEFPVGVHLRVRPQTGRTHGSALTKNANNFEGNLWDNALKIFR